MKYTTLGRTGAKVSIIGMGGGHTGLCGPGEEEALAMVHRALDMGINYIDSAYSYGGGKSENGEGKKSG